MGPAILTTIGILFLLSEFHGRNLSFDHTFPVILIVIGAILLASATVATDGHVDSSTPPVPPPAPPANPYQGQQGQGQ
jgi:drug/metabolite transporter (DMT)-like permease